MPWGPISELDLPFEVRRLRYERRKRQRTLTEREREIAVKIKKGVQDENGIRVPDIKILDEHGCTVRERRKVLDFVEGRRDVMWEPRERRKRMEIPKRPQSKYLEMLRTGGKMKIRSSTSSSTTGTAKKRKEKTNTAAAAASDKDKPKKQKFRSYADARKGREEFLKRLVEVIMHRNEWDDSDEEPAGPAAPFTAKEKDLLRYYYYIHNGIDTRYVAGINQKWFKRIMTMVPKRLQRNHRDIKKIHEEIKEDYLFAVKKSIVDFVLKVTINALTKKFILEKKFVFLMLL